MEEQVLYVSKARYDTLLRKFMCLKRENYEMKEAWKELKNRTEHIDERVLDDLHQFDTLNEEIAYIIGAFNSKKASKWDMEELEEKFNAENRK